MLDQLIALDSDLLLWLNSFHTCFLDRFVMLFTGRFVWIPMYAAILYTFYRTMTPKQLLAVVIGVALAITLSDQTVASVLRPIFQRMRPANLDNPLSEFVQVVDGYRGGRYGFPSCHGANSFALAVFASLMIRRRRFTVFIFIWAILNCLTRNYLGVHYPGDILVGAAIGSLFGWLCYRGVRAVCGLSAGELRSRSSVRLIPSVQGCYGRLRTFDSVIIVGIVTAVVLAAVALCRAGCSAG